MNDRRYSGLLVGHLTLLISLSLCWPGSYGGQKFSNVVEYPAKRDVYKYYFDISEGLTMSIWNETRQTYRPVLKIDDTFYVRIKDSHAPCNAMQPINQSLVDSMIMAAGRHRYILMVNQMFPGTPIVVPLNSHVEITVRNNLMAESVSIHWHGQTQKGTFYMDGVARLTQCSLGPGETFVYRFKATELGTHWYHSHAGMQRTDGLYGPFIVTNAYANGLVVDATRPQVNYDKEFYFMIQDWFQEDSASIFNHVLWEDIKFINGFENTNSCYTSNRMDDGTAAPMLPFDRETDAILINGKGSYKVMQKVIRIKDVDSILGFQAFDLDLEQFIVEPNKKYLFRAIGANAGHPLEIRIGGHKLYVVASDGNAIKPIEADSLIINGGERYDFYIQTKNQKSTNFFITVKTLETLDDNFKEIKYDNFGLAVLKYANVQSSQAVCADACDECTLDQKCTKVNCPFWPNSSEGIYDCVPVSRFEASDPTQIDNTLLQKNYTSSQFEEHFLNFIFSGSVALRSSINGIRFTMPSIPPYFRYNSNSALTACAGYCDLEDRTCQCSHRLELGLNKVVQMVLFNMGSGAGIEGTSHPVHLHGHHFYVIHVGYPDYSPVNYTYMNNNHDLNCDSDKKLCNLGDWKNATWKMGNLPVGNFVNPPLKDTIFVPVGGYAVIRFKSDNIGYWLMHCHIEVHQGEGMSLIIQEGSHDEIADTVDFRRVNFCENRLDRLTYSDIV